MSADPFRDTHDGFWDGIDSVTRDFIRRMVSEGEFRDKFRTAGREWLLACAAEGLSTALDADLSDPRYRALYEARCAAATVGIERVRRRHITRVRDGLRFYTFALKHGLRKRPVPTEAVAGVQEWSVSMVDARAKLPKADQDKLATVDQLFLKLARQQYGGDGDRMSKRSDGVMRKQTMAYGSQLATRRVMDDIIRQGCLRGWTPFTLEGLLTPEHVTEYLYYSTKLDGSFYDESTIGVYERRIIDYIYRARTCGRTPIEIVTLQREAELREAIRLEQDRSHLWNKRSRKFSNSGEEKWYPTLAHVTGAIASLEEEIARLDDRRQHKRITRRKYWQGLRDAVLTLCTLYGMWRTDTASTISLLHLKKHRSTNDVIDANGFAVVIDSARAKNTSGEWYPFVKELILPPVIIALIEKLLAVEGRSLRLPLREGEEPVRLRADNGDSWGSDPLLVGELDVAPLFRLNPDRPEGMSYSAVSSRLELKLRWLRFGATNPHTLRAAGAIYWTFVRGMPEALVMKLGLWEDTKILRESYAQIHGDDQRTLMLDFMPAQFGTPRRVHGRREQAAAQSLTVLAKLLEKPTGAHEARRYLAELKTYYEVIDQTIAAELQKRWEPIRPDRFLQGELEQLDEELRAHGCEGGVDGVLGRRVTALGILHELATEADSTRALPPAVRSAWQLVSPPTPPALRAGPSDTSDEAA